MKIEKNPRIIFLSYCTYVHVHKYEYYAHKRISYVDDDSVAIF